jgi:hypothetical protein
MTRRGIVVDSATAALRQYAMLIHLEFALPYLIQSSGITQRRADRRLNGFENTIAALAKQWRAQLPLVPARDLRMADHTREELIAWVGAHDASQGHTLQRLAVYASGAATDNGVPEGWVRLYLVVAV